MSWEHVTENTILGTFGGSTDELSRGSLTGLWKDDGLPIDYSDLFRCLCLIFCLHFALKSAAAISGLDDIG